MGIARLGGQWGRQLAMASVPAATGQGRPGVTGGDGSGPPPPPDENENFEALTKYIPTETITMFIAAIGTWRTIEDLPASQAAERAAQAAQSAGLDLTDYTGWIIYAVFALLTPLLVWLTAYSSYWRARRALPADSEPTPFAMPKFRMVAALVAFLVWALAVPGMQTDAVWQIAAPLAALVVSTFLSLFEPIFGN